MLTVAITGGIATGKSTAALFLAESLGCESFSADACVKELLAEDKDVQQEIVNVFGKSVIRANLEVDRGKLREIVFQNERHRRRLESILHPRVRAAWLRRAEALKSFSDFFVTEIPLLFETGGDALCDRIVTIGCAIETQLKRLQKYRGMPSEIALRIIEAQSPLEEKMRRSHYVVWNDSNEKESLKAQCRLISDHLRQAV